MANTTAIASGVNRYFAAPYNNSTGTNTMQMLSVEMNAGIAICVAVADNASRALLEDILSELKRAGFRNIVLYNWHYENSGFIYEPAFLISEKHPELKILVMEDANPDFTADRQQAIWPEGFPGLALEHAAVIETSLLLHHAPHLVRTEHIKADAPERVVNHDVLPIDTRMSTASGTLSSPEAASAEKGKMLTEWMVDRLVAILDDEFGDRRGGTA